MPGLSRLAADETREKQVVGAAFVLRAMDRAVMWFVTAAAAMALALAAILAFSQVIMRFIFASPSTWSEATAQLLIVWMVHLGVVVTMRSGTLVSVEFIRNLMGRRLQPVIELLIAIACLFFLGNLLVFGLQVVERVQFQNHPALGISIAWGYAAVPVGAAFSIIATIARTVEQLGSRTAWSNSR